MTKYIMLLNWTDQGIKAVKDSPKRLDAARALGKGLGVDIEQFFMTIGAYDMVLVADAPDDETFASFVLKTAQAGNVRSQSLKAFDEAAYRGVIAKA